MARSYGGILGLLAFAAVIARGCIHGGGAQATLFAAWLSLLIGYPLGCIVGMLGDWMVLESIRVQLASELAANEAKDTASAAKSKP